MAGTQTSKNSLFKVTISAAFVTVARIVSSDGPGIVAPMMPDLTNDHATAEGQIPTEYTQQKPFTAKLNLDPSGTTDKFIINAAKAPAAAGIAVKRVWPDGAEWTWTGTFTSVMPHDAAGQPLTMDIEHTPHGAITVPA